MDHIDAILYINLAHRIDRNEHIIKEIHKLCEDDSKIHRIDAIKHPIGAIGCGYSHIKALDYALEHPEWKTILVLEDDFTFKSDFPIEIQTRIDMFLKYGDGMDIGLLSYNHNFLKYNNTGLSFIKRLSYSQTTSSYLIKSHYLEKLKRNFEESTRDMTINGKRHENCIDIHWTKLMTQDTWYCIYPALGYQYECYSDIENRVVSYEC
jgi:glycosyl transferase, family 25